MTPRTSILIGAVLGATGVAAGAFGAHELKSILTPDLLATYETAVRYQLIHALAMVLTGLLAAQRPSRAAQVAAWAYLAGVLLFSGCLYVWVLIGWKPLALVVPAGGTAFILGWMALAAAALRP